MKVRPSSLGALGRLAVKTAMKVSDYLQGVTAEARSRKLVGAEILRRLDISVM